MNCNEFETQLDRCIEEKLAPTTELVSHATSCKNSSCCDRWEEHQLLERTIQAWLASVPVVDLTEAVISNSHFQLDDVEVLGPVPMIRKQQPQSPATGAIVAVVSLLVTAALLIAVTLRSSTSDLAINSPRVASENEIIPQSIEQTLTEEQKLRELGQTYASLMTDAKTRVSETVAMVIPDEDSMLTEGMGSASAWLDAWSERLEPLETKLDNTLRNFVDETLTKMNDQAS